MRLGWVPLVAVVVCCLGVGEARAQGQDTGSMPTGPVSAPAATPKTVFQSLKNFGSFGADMGVMRFTSDSDASKNALVRPSMQAVFRYRFNDNWVGVSEFGFGWNAYRDKGDTVLTVMSGTLGGYRHVSDLLGLDWKVGGGVGMYRWNYKFNGRSIRDRDTQLFLRAIDPGVFVGMEAERRLAAHVTLHATTQLHYLFSANKTDFPTMLGGNDSFAVIRFGVNYHFSPYEGILWERKVKRTIKLTSGKAGS
jgi:hypothetical protein